MTAYATTADLEARLGKTFSATEMIRAEAALEDASALIRSVARPITWLVNDEPTNVPDIVKTVTLAAARRSMNNPMGVTQASTGDASVSYSGERSTSGGGGAGGVVYLSASEREDIRRAANHPHLYSTTL